MTDKTPKPSDSRAAVRGLNGYVARYRRAIDHKIERVPIDRLTPFERHARTHGKDQIAMLCGSFDAFGLIDPLIVDQDDRILAGHARWQAARELGYAEVPVVRIDHLTEDEKRAYVIAANRTAETAGWNLEILAGELEYLSSIDLGFDVDVIGFSVGEIDVLVDKAARSSDPVEEIDAPSGPAVSRPGDLWLIGPHRLFCGDALEAANYEVAMNGLKARTVLTDPPYNLPIDGFVSGLGRKKNREFVMASGEMTEAGFTAFLTSFLREARQHIIDGGILYAFMDWRHLGELLSAGRAADLKLLNLCVWDKQKGGMGSWYRSQHELCFVFKAGNAPHPNNVELGRHGRNRTNVWSFPGLNAFGRDRDDLLAKHPSVKPVAMLAEAIKDCTRRRDVVLDPFCGSGSTLLAAHKTGRIGVGIELDPVYVDTAVRRLEKATGLNAVHAESGLGIAALAARRQDTAGAGGGDVEASAVALAKVLSPVRHRVRPGNAAEATNG